MCREIQAKLEEEELFTKVWVDKTDLKDNMLETIAKSIKQSKVVFVLLSDNYCESVFCRREWYFAVTEKIKVYVIFVQEGFNRQKYDWAKFMIGADLYYKKHDEADFQNFIVQLRDFLHSQSDDIPKKNENSNQAGSLPPPPKNSISNREYLKKSITIWTFEDVQNWCIDSHLDKWLKTLNNYDGQNLFKFHQDLSNDVYVSDLLKKIPSLAAPDVSRFKSEIDKILSKTTARKPPTKTSVRNRRTSNTSNK